MSENSISTEQKKEKEYLQILEKFTDYAKSEPELSMQIMLRYKDENGSFPCYILKAGKPETYMNMIESLVRKDELLFDALFAVIFKINQEKIAERNKSADQ